jgi:hypothetical protein
MEKTFAAFSSIEFLEGVEFVIHFVSRNVPQRTQRNAI